MQVGQHTWTNRLLLVMPFDAQAWLSSAWQGAVVRPLAREFVMQWSISVICATVASLTLDDTTWWCTHAHRIRLGKWTGKFTLCKMDVSLKQQGRYGVEKKKKRENKNKLNQFTDVAPPPPPKKKKKKKKRRKDDEVILNVLGCLVTY